MKDRIESVTKKVVPGRERPEKVPAFIAVRPRPGCSFYCSVHCANFEGPGIKFQSGNSIGDVCICPDCLAEMTIRMTEIGVGV